MEAFCLETKMKDVAMPCHARLQLGVDSLILSERSIARTVRIAVVIDRTPRVFYFGSLLLRYEYTFRCENSLNSGDCCGPRSPFRATIATTQLLL